MIVYDTNLIAYLLIEGPYSVLADQFFYKFRYRVVPHFLKIELLNVLITYGRTGRLTSSEIEEKWNRAQTLELMEEEPSIELVLKLALENGCSAYDSMFVALAVEHDLMLATFDGQLLKKFPQYAVHPEILLRV